MAETESTQSASLLGHLRGAEGDRLTERSEERKLPQLEPRALVTPRELITSSSGVLRGGDARGDGVLTQSTRPEIRSRSRLCRAVSD